MIGAVLACAFLGDSTALGAAQAFNRATPSPCAVMARVGAGVAEVARLAASAVPVGTAVVAASSNDPASPSLAADLIRLRTNLRAGRVLWILPYDRGAAATAERVATAYGDHVMDLAELPTRDHLHSLTYAGLAIALRRWRLGE
jgi:hypothetical protein